MYRCFACDSPAQANCGCYTQMEHPTLTLTGELRQAEDDRPVRNISSGEDAVIGYVYEENM